MSRLASPEPCGRAAAILVAGDVDADEVLRAVGEAWGPVGPVSRESAFAHTDFYEAEMGPGLRRLFAGIEGLSDPRGLPELKLRAIELEARWSREGRRRVNLDPAFVNLHQVVLATGKTAGHRVYLDRGVYAEVEYVFADGTFRPLPWTYPDYRTREAIAFFNGLRQAYKLVRKRELTIHN